MNREDILAKSQQENRGMDVASLEVSKTSILFGWSVLVVLLGAVAVADALVFERVNYETFFALMTGCSAVFFSKYRKLRRKHELVLAVVYAVIAAAFLAAWILQLTRWGRV